MTLILFFRPVAPYLVLGIAAAVTLLNVIVMGVLPYRFLYINLLLKVMLSLIIVNHTEMCHNFFFFFYISVNKVSNFFSCLNFFFLLGGTNP